MSNTFVVCLPTVQGKVIVTGNKFIASLEEIARLAGMTAPSIRAYPDWMLFDVQEIAGLPGRTYIAVATFTSAVDICNRISDEAAAYVLRQQVAEGAPK